MGIQTRPFLCPCHLISREIPPDDTATRRLSDEEATQQYNMILEEQKNTGKPLKTILTEMEINHAAFYRRKVVVDVSLVDGELFKTWRNTCARKELFRRAVETT